MQFRRVVIGVDFTEASLAAARWAGLQLAPRAEIVLVHALPAPDAPPYLRRHLRPDADVARALVPVFDGALRGLASVIGKARTRVRVAAGAPADVLAAAAHACDADLVCVGRGSRRRGSARFGATTAHRLLARTRVPTVVVPAGRHDVPARLLAAFDARAGGEEIVRVACGLAAAFEARVDALHVIGDDVRALARTAPSAPDDATDAPWLRPAARAWVARALDAAGALPSRATPVIRVGDPGEQIVAQLAASDVDLVIVGRGGDRSHAALPAGALPVGSTTRLVTWAAACPVLVLPPDGTTPRPRARAHALAARGITAITHAEGRDLPSDAA